MPKGSPAVMSMGAGGDAAHDKLRRKARLGGTAAFSAVLSCAQLGELCAARRGKAFLKLHSEED